jgi:hypothetical protein
MITITKINTVLKHSFEFRVPEDNEFNNIHNVKHDAVHKNFQRHISNHNTNITDSFTILPFPILIIATPIFKHLYETYNHITVWSSKKFSVQDVKQWPVQRHEVHTEFTKCLIIRKSLFKCERDGQTKAARKKVPLENLKIRFKFILWKEEMNRSFYSVRKRFLPPSLLPETHSKVSFDIYIHTYIHVLANIHTYICTYMHTCNSIYTSPYIHTCIHMYIHTYISRK